MHVDTVTTHVISAIINVDQHVVDDWKLVILDHEDQEHSVVMKPGDMLLYESAKLLHGRPGNKLLILFTINTCFLMLLLLLLLLLYTDKFNGYHYDNIFIHYKPRTHWDYDWL